MVDSYLGSQDHGTAGSDFGAMDFIIRRIMGRMATNTLVVVKAVRPGTGGAVGRVDVQPMVNQIDGANNAMPHGVIQNVPYFRLQGGASAILIDPAVGDIGIATFASEDISSVKVNGAVSNPGSRRRFSMGDALYLGGVLNGVPTQIIQLDPATGITITSATGLPVTINAPGGCTVTSPSVALSGDLSVAGDITTGAGSTFNGKSFDTHTHGGVTTGSGESGPPS